MLGLLPWIVSISMSSPDCLVSMDTFLPNLCKIEQAFYDGISLDEGCQIKASNICNLTIQTALDQFPSLQRCVCSWEEELCDSIQTLAAQCLPKPVYSGGRSCFDRVAVCVSDAVCNKYLVHILVACSEDQCDRVHCQQVAQQFFGFMPHSVAEMLVMCECEASNKNCMQIKAALRSHTCGHTKWICQDTFKECVEDEACRIMLKTLRTKCWRPDEAQCGERDRLKDERFTQMDPAFILGAKPECRKAFMATLGSSLHYLCSCQGVHNDDLVTCNIIHDLFQNRSHFLMSSKSSSGPSKPPETNESEQRLTRSHEYLLYAFAALLLVGVVVVMPLVVISKIWILRKRERNKIPCPQSSNCVVIL